MWRRGVDVVVIAAVLVVGVVSGDNSTRQAPCVCVPFERCQDGDLVDYGDHIDIRLGSADKCRGFNVCCNVVGPLLQYIEQTSESADGDVIMMSVQDALQHILATEEPAPAAADGDDEQGEAAPESCVCMEEYLCEQGSLEMSKAEDIDIRYMSSTGRCSSGDQVCCTVKLNQSQGCDCVTSQQCLTNQTVALNNSQCSAEEVCCIQQPDLSELNQTEEASNTTGGYNHWTFCKAYPLSIGCAHSRELHTMPTVRAAENFDPEEDAKAIRRELRIGGAIGNTLISTLVNRTYEQRHSISQHYHSLYGNDLFDAVSFWTLGMFEDTVQTLLKATSFDEFQAIMLYEAMSGLGTDEDAVIETVITSTPAELRAIEPIFERLAGESLEAKIASEFSGHVRDILLSAVRGERDQTNYVDPAEAKRQAKILYEAGSAIYGTDEDPFKELLTSQNYAQLALTMSEYQTLTGRTLEDDVESEFTNDLENIMLAIVHVTRNVPRFFATRLRAILSNLRREDVHLMRILVSRSEKDLGTIVHEYRKMYDEELADRIEWKTLGNYENILLALIGSPEF